MALEDYDDEFDKGCVVDAYGKVKLEYMPDGEYRLEVAATRVKDENDMVAVDLTILTEGKLFGAKLEKAYFLTEKEKDSAGNLTGKRIKNDRNVTSLFEDFKNIGLDPDEWKKANGRPFSSEVKKAMKAIIGCGIIAKKMSRKGDSRTFHEIKFTGRTGEDGKPNPMPAEYLNESAKDPFDLPD